MINNSIEKELINQSEGITLSSWYGLNFQSLSELVDISAQTVREIGRELTGNEQTSLRELQGFLQAHPHNIQKLKAEFFCRNIQKIAEIYQQSPMNKRF